MSNLSDNYFIDQDKQKSEEAKIRKNPGNIISVEQTEANCLLAVSLWGHALKVIPKALHTNEICLTAVKQCGSALRFASKKMITEEICLEAIKNDSRAFNLVPQKFITLEFCVLAHEVNSDTYQYIPSEFRSQIVAKIDTAEYKTSEALVNQIKLNETSLKDVPAKNKSKLLCLTAVRSNPLELEFVPSRFKTLELCNIALEKDLRSIYYFPQEFLTLEFVKSWFEDVINFINDEIEESELNISILEYSRQSKLHYQLKKIVPIFSEDINEHHEVILLQRKLGLRKFNVKKYDLSAKLFVTVESVCHHECFNKDEERAFSDFMEFYAHVNGDLSNADLYDFDFHGVDLTKMNIIGALISSKTLVEHGLYDDTFYNSILPSNKYLITPSISMKNEIIAAQELLHIEDMSATKLNNDDIKFYYVSDLHLMHKIASKFSMYATETEITKYIKDIIDTMINTAKDSSYNDYLLIGGDISFNFNISRIFYTELAKRWRSFNIIVVLGNHELWDATPSPNGSDLIYSNDSVQETIEKYRDLFDGLRIKFLHNQLLVLDEGRVRISSEEQILGISENRLKEVALKSPFIIIGGLGFSGYSAEFNALNGLYRNKVTTLEDDLMETQRFETLYTKLKQVIPQEKVIVFSHTPKSNWSNDSFNPNWIYVSGHTHKNEYTIDDTKTVYADNQIGYKSTSFGLKSFNLAGIYDVFRHYQDGMYVIKREQYNEFNRGMKILSTCNRATGIIHMLKKQNNYCFFYEESGRLYLLKGGAIKKAEYPLEYYFDKLDIYSNAIKVMLSGYNLALKQLSNEVKKIGGDGNIHGCIVDIDFYNHIYLNPIDGTITPYYATDIVHKKVYRSVKSLLKENNKALYDSYIKALKTSSSTLSLSKMSDSIDVELSRYVFDTSMYEPSRIMKSLQYITEANIIRNWNNELMDKISSKAIQSTNNNLLEQK